MKIHKIEKPFVQTLLPRRSASSHKGDYGRVLVAAGSRGMTGAAVLSARAALKAGAGLVTVACPDSERHTIACALPEAMTFGASCRDGAFTLSAAAEVASFSRSRKIDVLLIGPGLSDQPGAFSFAAKLLRMLDIPAVIDADALNALASGPRPLKVTCAPAIFTPHPGEASRLLRRAVSDRASAVRDLAAITSGTVVLKGSGTLICGGGKILKNVTGGPALAKGGSGDVLAGLCAGFFAQVGRAHGFTPVSALRTAALAVYLHGLCGDLAAKKFTERCVLAGELLDFLPAALRRTAE